MSMFILSLNSLKGR